MNYDPTRRHRRSTRLLAYDYAQAGAYFVTIACKDGALLLEDPRLREVVEETWLWLADQYEFVELDAFVVMPNHLHGVIVIGDTGRGGSRTAHRRVNHGILGFAVSQRDHYEHVISNDEELDRLRRYVVNAENVGAHSCAPLRKCIGTRG